jgi:Tfp pilus assembly protein PilV
MRVFGCATSRAPGDTRRMPRGFTLIESLVALLLLELGMLALAATSAVAARDLAIAHRTGRAQAIARNQLEALGADGCAARAGSTTVAGGYDVSWTVEASGRQKTLSVRVAFNLPRGRPRVVMLRSAALCSP